MTHRALCIVTIGSCGLALSGCAEDRGTGSYGDALADPQLPPRGADDLPRWLAAGYYQWWRCEPAAHPGRSPSPHGANRICNNDALHGASPGAAFTAGAASVKEIFDGDRVTAYAVSRKLADGTGGDRWYWYEASGDQVYANRSGAGNCTGCHTGADRDFVFTIVP